MWHFVCAAHYSGNDFVWGKAVGITVIYQYKALLIDVDILVKVVKISVVVDEITDPFEVTFSCASQLDAV